MKITPQFTEAQAKAVRVALSYASESEDGQLRRTARNARKELDEAELKAREQTRARQSRRRNSR